MNSIPPGALQQLLPEILPKAVAWAEEHSAEISALGSALGEAGLSIARRVGVRQPELIRVSMIRQMPFPAAPLLREAAAMTGLLGSGTIGLTLGHGIYIRQGHYSPRLLSHECRHVYQPSDERRHCERARNDNGSRRGAGLDCCNGAGLCA